MKKGLFDGKSILITGGTGSFGRYMTESLLKLRVRSITILSRDEEKQLEMQREFSDSRLNYVIADVRDLPRLHETLRRTDYVYHAAALKIIPTCEAHPIEAIKTNLLGTLNVKNACKENHVKKAVLVSSDKGVEPVNTYGMSKALAERVWLARDGSITKFAVVRYGNVVGSRGSVVPYFRELIHACKPLPVTSPRMSRFLITLEDSRRLVYMATEKMRGGEIFVRNCPACDIPTLVSAMVPHSYPIEVVGIRPGEKIAETLISEDEMRRTEKRNGYFIIHPFGRYHSKIERGKYTSETTKQLNAREVRNLLKQGE